MSNKSIFSSHQADAGNFKMKNTGTLVFTLPPTLFIQDFCAKVNFALKCTMPCMIYNLDYEIIIRLN